MEKKERKYDIRPVAESLLGDHRERVKSQGGGDSKDILKIMLLNLGIGVGNRFLQGQATKFLQQEPLRAQQVKYKTALDGLDTASATYKEAQKHAGGVTDFYTQRNLAVIHSKAKEALGDKYHKEAVDPWALKTSAKIAQEQQLAMTNLIEAGRNLEGSSDIENLQKIAANRPTTVGGYAIDKISGLFGQGDHTTREVVKAVRNSNTFKNARSFDKFEEIYSQTNDLRQSATLAAALDKLPDAVKGFQRNVSSDDDFVKTSVNGSERNIAVTNVTVENSDGEKVKKTIPKDPKDAKHLAGADGIDYDKRTKVKNLSNYLITIPTGVIGIQAKEVTAYNAKTNTTTTTIVPSTPEDQRLWDLQTDKHKIETSNKTIPLPDGSIGMLTTETITDLGSGVQAYTTNVASIQATNNTAHSDSVVAAGLSDEYLVRQSDVINTALTPDTSEALIQFFNQISEAKGEEKLGLNGAAARMYTTQVATSASRLQNDLGIPEKLAMEVSADLFVSNMSGNINIVENPIWFDSIEDLTNTQRRELGTLDMGRLETYFRLKDKGGDSLVINGDKLNGSGALFAEFDALSLDSKKEIMREVVNNSDSFIELYRKTPGIRSGKSLRDQFADSIRREL